MEYLRGYGALRDDPKWVSKILTGAVLFLSAMCIPILGSVIVTGWSDEVMRRELRGARELPPLEFSFEQWKPYIELGIKHLIVQMAYSAPLMIVMFVFGFTAQIALIFGAKVLGEENLMPLFAVFGLVVVPLMIALFVLFQIAGLYAAIRVAITGELGKGFEFRTILSGVRRVGLELALGVFLIGLVAIPLHLLGMLACFVGVFATSTLVVGATSFLRADIARLDAARGGPPLPATIQMEIVHAFR